MDHVHKWYDTVTWLDYRRSLDWYSDLLNTLTHNSWLHLTNHWHTRSSLRCLAAGSNGGRYPSSGLPNCSQPRYDLLQISTDWLPADFSLSTGSWPSLYSLRIYGTENTASNSSSNVTWTRCLAIALILLHAYEAAAEQRACLQSRSLAMAVPAAFTVLPLSKHAIIFFLVHLVFRNTMSDAFSIYDYSGINV
jgi:hypothetical protein